MGKATRTVDQRLAMAVLEKQRRGETPTREEASALRRCEKQLEEEQRLKHFKAVRKGEWATWSGRQVKVINEQAERYGLPLGAADIDITVLARALHDFLANNARKLAGADDDDPSLAGVASPALERKRQFDCQLLELRLQREQGFSIERRLVHEGHNRLGGILRIAGEALQRQFGPAAQKILNDALDNCEREVDRLLAADLDHADPHECGAG
jgi:Fe-S cluster biosynthesis and repair protein YggX